MTPKLEKKGPRGKTTRRSGYSSRIDKCMKHSLTDLYEPHEVDLGRLRDQPDLVHLLLQHQVHFLRDLGLVREEDLELPGLELDAEDHGLARGQEHGVGHVGGLKEGGYYSGYEILNG